MIKIDLQTAPEEEQRGGFTSFTDMMSGLSTNPGSSANPEQMAKTAMAIATGPGMASAAKSAATAGDLVL